MRNFARGREKKPAWRWMSCGDANPEATRRSSERRDAAFSRARSRGEYTHTSARTAADIRARFPHEARLPVPAAGWLRGLKPMHDWAMEQTRSQALGALNYAVTGRLDGEARRDFAWLSPVLNNVLVLFQHDRRRADGEAETIHRARCQAPSSG